MYSKWIRELIESLFLSFFFFLSLSLSLSIYLSLLWKFGIPGGSTTVKEWVCTNWNTNRIISCFSVPIFPVLFALHLKIQYDSLYEENVAEVWGGNICCSTESVIFQTVSCFQSWFYVQKMVLIYALPHSCQSWHLMVCAFSWK